MKNSLQGVKIANYYGCMYTRPRHIFPEKDAGPGSESTSEPHFMDDLLAAAGAENVDFPLKTACCGGAHTLSDSDISTKLVLNILEAAEAAGADVIATECPTCHTGLEMHQIRAEKRLGRKTAVKILYFTQLLGMALGLSAAQGRRAGEYLRFARLPEGEGAGMTPFADIEAALDGFDPAQVASKGADPARRLLGLAEAVLENWAAARGETPTRRRARGLPPARRCTDRARAASPASTPAARPAARSPTTPTCCAWSRTMRRPPGAPP